MKKSPRYVFPKQSRSKDKVDYTPGPADYHIPCSVRDIANHERKKGKFNEVYTYI